jgi:hypothetical protein
VPEADALGEGLEGGQAGAVDGGEEELEAPLGLGAVAGAVDVAEALLRVPGLGDDRVALEQLAQAPRSRPVRRSRALSRRWRAR